MNRLNKVIVVLNIILILLIVIKVINQKVIINYELSNSTDSLENIRNNLYYELEVGVGKYSKYENGKRINTSEKIKEGQALEDGLKVEDYKIEFENGSTHISAKVVNDSSEEKGDYYAYLNLFDENDFKIFNIIVYINKVAPNSNIVFNSSISQDISNIYRCELEKIEEEI